MDGAPAAPTSDRVRVRRMAERARYEREVVEAILDEGFVCHVAFAGTDGTPWVIPTAYGRDGDTLYLHGAVGNHMLRSLGAGATACVVVTLVDGLVLARSTVHHSINYRSVVVFGTPRLVTDPDEKARALETVVEHIVPGRTAEVRPSTGQEVRRTAVLALPIDEASAKVRTGPPVDDEEDIVDGVWGGVLPFVTRPAVPVPDEYCGATAAPPSVAGYCRGA
jgi:nitroimidazol reductase NimA-like FMN-containing flavoprotein (pyridoxamine 5'-phosphate oxidase superfamily)